MNMACHMSTQATLFHGDNMCALSAMYCHPSDIERRPDILLPASPGRPDRYTHTACNFDFPAFLLDSRAADKPNWDAIPLTR